MIDKSIRWFIDFTDGITTKNINIRCSCLTQIFCVDITSRNTENFYLLHDVKFSKSYFVVISG